MQTCFENNICVNAGSKLVKREKRRTKIFKIKNTITNKHTQNKQNDTKHGNRNKYMKMTN